jgi:hypothetical protein
MAFDPARTLMILTNRDPTDVLGWGGSKVTFATADPLAPGEPGGYIGFEGEEAQPALFLIADAGKDPDYHISWITGKK